MAKPSLFHAVVLGGSALALGCAKHHRVERRPDVTVDARIVFPDAGGPDTRTARSCDECEFCSADIWCQENCVVACIL